MFRDSDETPPVVTLLEPATAAKRLGVSASGLRRLAPIYEEMHGELPRKGSGAEDKRARLWPVEAIERLQDARRLVELERFRTIAEALKAIQDGVSVETVELEPGGRQTGSQMATQQALELLLAEVQAMRAELAELRAERERQLEPSAEQVDTEQHGPLVRVALWIDRTFKK